MTTPRLIKVFVVEDDRSLCHLYAANLGRESRIETVEAHTLAEATQLCRQERQVALLVDLNLPDATGVEAISRARMEAPGATIVAISGDAHLRKKALEAGAHEWIDKASPQSFGDEMISVVLNAVDRHTHDQIFAPIEAAVEKLAKKIPA